MEKLKNNLKTRHSRRSFLAGAGAAGAATLVAGCNDSGTGIVNTPPTIPAPLTFPDNDVLNFALNLEYLEAEFFLRAATGSGLPTAYIGTDTSGTGAGTVTGGAKVTGLSAPVQQYLNEIAQTELSHVIALRATISGNSGTPVARPNINFTAAFNALASAAGIGSSFDPFTGGQGNYLVGAFVFEDVGVTAYNGAAPLLTNNNILTSAAGIMAVEAYHAAEIRSLIAAMAAVTGADQTALTNANKISTLRGTLGGGNETQLSVNTIVPANSNALAYARTTDQVLHIVYGTGGGAGVKGGGFFPNGMNGTITTTAS